VADYDAKIRVSADTKQAESELSKLQKRITQLGEAAFKLDARNFQKSVRDIGTAVQGIGQRGALGALTLAAGKATTALGGLGTKFGILGAAAASAGATVNSALGGVPAVITDILNHIGQVPNAFGIAAVAAMAFAPQILKASSAATGLATAVDKAVGAQTTQKIAQVIDNIGQLNTELNATASTFKDLISGSTLNQLNNQLKDAVKQSGEFHSSTEDAVVAAEQLVAVQKEQRKEQKAINDLIRQAQGLQPQDVRDAELNRRVALLKSREIQQQKDLKLQTQINAELAEYERLAAQVAAQTKLWASNLERIARSSKAGVFGTQSQLRTRVQEFQENRRSAEIARERSAELMARERAMAGGQYSLAQVPARGELFPGGRTETASDQYRSMLNEQARIRAAASDALARSERTVIGLQAQTLKTEQQITAAKRQQQSVDERSIQILRDQNKLLMEQYRAQQRVASGTLDPASLRADRQRRVEQGRAAQARRREMTENVIIGGAFPMLFGGGVGTVAGGALGGLIPGNPMLSVATSAVGALVDQFVASVTEAGSAMRDPITNFQKLADAGLIASRSQKQYIERLIEAGRVTEAATVIQDELIKKIGVEGLRDLQNAGAASDKLNKAFAEFSLQAQAAIAGPLAGILSWLANVIAIGNRATREAVNQTDILQGLSAQDQAALQREEQRILQGANLFNEAQKRQQVSQLYQSYAGRATMQRPGTSIDKTPELQAQAQTKELAAQVQLEGQKLSLVGMSLERNGQAYIATAKAVALQEYENRLLEIKNGWIGKAYDAERNRLMITQANLQYAGKLKAIDAEQLKQLKDQRDARSAILGLQTELLQTTIAAADIDVEFARLRGGEAAALQEEVNQLNSRFNVEAKILELQTQQKLLTKDITAQETQLINTIYKEQLANLKAQYDIRVATRKEALALIALNKFVADAAAKQQALQPFEDLRKNRELEVQYSKTYLRLVTEGVLPAEAERIANFERLVSEQLNALDKQIAITQAALVQAEAYGASADKLKELREELERLESARGTTATTAAQGPGEGKTGTERLGEALAVARGQLNELTDPINQIIAGAQAIGDAFQQAFKGLVSGAMTGREALAAFFKSVGDHFLDMASKMIAKLIEIYILETVIGFISGAVSSGFTSKSNAAGKATFGGSFKGTGSSTFGSGGIRVPGYAEGGFVTGPTRALIGEGGEPEYVIPQSKMSAAMSRYSRGARGESVIAGSGSSSESGGTATAPMAPIDVRYSVERINNVDYVTADQFRAGMAQAAQQGAIQGERRAMRSLKNSAATRRSVGV
jgi:hypothetical protein